jgi:hypothetical protein
MFVVDCYQLLILIFLEQVIEGRGSNNLTEVIMGALKKHGDVFNANVARNLMSFRADGVNVF